MSRVGKAPVEIVSGVTVDISGQKVNVNGSKGKLSVELPGSVKIEKKDNELIFTPANDSTEARAKWGMSRALVSSMVKGVSEGFKENLEITGVGFKAAVQGKILKLNLGFSHDVNFPIPEGIQIKCAKPTEIEITGADKQLVGQVASKLRSMKKPEPYKGKGIKYAGEKIRRKEGKKK